MHVKQFHTGFSPRRYQNYMYLYIYIRCTIVTGDRFVKKKIVDGLIRPPIICQSKLSIKAVNILSRKTNCLSRQ